MSNALIVRTAQLPTAEKALRAAQYVRMSTDKQLYSIQNQAAAIAAYAHAHSLKIVRTYADEGESGLRIKNRDGLKQLIQDITTKNTDYGHLLVYDVSRWGRFQDTDESAHYEFICKQAGVKVEYCAEQFDNDGSMLSSIVKNLKRVMAAEYSRELSTKVYAAQSRLVRLGFRHGGPLGYGLSRELVDENQRSKGRLRRGERKSLPTDRVRVRPGTGDEIAVVRWIFQQALRKTSDSKIARELNQRAVPSGTGRPWKPHFVSRILQNENYIGNIVFNRTSHKLGARRVSNPHDLWVRGEQCIEPIVDSAAFQRVQRIIGDRRTEISGDEMLARLRRTLHKRGRLSIAIIDGTNGLPCADTYRHHFGSLRNAYRLIGYAAGRNYAFVDEKEAWDEVTTNLMQQVAATLERMGRQVVIDFSDDRLRIDGKVGVLFRVARTFQRKGHLTTWRVPRLRKMPHRWIVAIRLTDDNKSIRDYLMIPAKGLAEKHRCGSVMITDKSRDRLGFHRFETAKALARSINREIRTQH
jgi:DNA invertase Pin-like site-specific DNA recombinase